MKFFTGLVVGISATILFGAVAWWSSINAPPSTTPTKATPPAHVNKTLKEDQINQIALTESAMKHLALRMTPVARKEVRRVRAYGGEITIPTGRSILVAAPLGGTLSAPAGGVPEAGTEVRQGQPVFLLAPLLTPESRITTASANVEAEGQVKNAQSQVEAAKIALDRAKRLFAEQAGSQRAVDDAQALYDLAEKSLEASNARRELLAKVVGDIERGTATPIAVESPEDGLIRIVSALPGQIVPSGAALFEVVDLHEVWVRVPIYVGDLSELDGTQPATVRGMGEHDSNPIMAQPMKAPPTANHLSGTADFYYEMPNPGNQLAPGQRVKVTISLKGEQSSLVVPWSAVIHDIQGGTWVYEQIGPSSFVRRRVQIAFVDDGFAVLETGPPQDTQVVSEGAAELFGTEVGFSK